MSQDLAKELEDACLAILNPVNSDTIHRPAGIDTMFRCDGEVSFSVD